MENALAIKETGTPTRRRLSLNTRKAARAEEAVSRPTAARPPAKQREGGWGHYEWLSWQDRLLPGLNSTQREPIVRDICGIKSAMYYKLNQGSQFPSERVELRCKLAELCMKVAKGENVGVDQVAASNLLQGREFEMVMVVATLAQGKVRPIDRKLAARAVRLSDITALQVHGKGADLDHAH